VPFVCEVKARKDGSGFAQLERWLGDFDLLALRRNNADPLIILPWRVWATLPSKVPRNAPPNRIAAQMQARPDRPSMGAAAP
jgi:hypothetical protein